MIRTIDELRPDARAVAQRFLDAATGAARRGRRAELRAELSAHLCERLAPDASPAEVEQVVAGLGSDDRGGRPRVDWPSGLRPRGVFDRIADTWWRPSDPRLLLPRAVGLGWDVNLGAVAVRLKLIEPDAEAVPFASTPDAAFGWRRLSRSSWPAPPCCITWSAGGRCRLAWHPIGTPPATPIAGCRRDRRRWSTSR